MDPRDLIRRLTDGPDCNCDECRQHRGLPPMEIKSIRILTDSEREEYQSFLVLREGLEKKVKELKALDKELTARKELFWIKVERSLKLDIDNPSLQINTKDWSIEGRFEPEGLG